MNEEYCDASLLSQRGFSKNFPNKSEDEYSRFSPITCSPTHITLACWLSKSKF